MTSKKPVLRKCVVTKEMIDKKKLLRVVKTANGEIKLDLTGKINGKGSYLKAEKEILELAIRNKSLERSLKSQIPHVVYEEIKKYCK
jgi:uncharacterized protein